MRDEEKSKDQLLSELAELRSNICSLKESAKVLESQLEDCNRELKAAEERCREGIYSDLNDKKLAERLLHETNEKYRHLVENAPTGIFEIDMPVKASVIVHDITEREKMEEKLRQSERFLANIFDSLQDRLTVIDTEFNIVRVNKKVKQHYGHSRSIIGSKCYSVYYGYNEVCQGCPGQVTLMTGKEAQAVMPFKDPEGNVKAWLSHYCCPLIDERSGEIQGVIVYARDITEKIKTEREMARLDRLNLVGEMAASIGHEIRNPMTAVRGFLQMLTSKEECVKYKNYFGIMIDELDRANNIISEFLSLSRNKPVLMKCQDLNAIIRAILPLFEVNAINFRVDIDLDLGTIPELLVNEKDIRQLIHNLVRNGLEAMSPGKKLIIRTYFDGEYVVLSIKDQGEGIDPGLIEKVGTPFFTTKDNGTGLGLAVCYGIASRHNAAICFETGPGGTTFDVKFRAADHAASGSTTDAIQNE